MKKLICMMLVLTLIAGMTAVACAENNKLSDFANRLKKAAQQQTAQETEAEPAQEQADVSYGPALRTNDPFYQKVRSSAYLQEDKYSKEANVMIELKNVSGRTLYPNKATVTAYNADGAVIKEQNYSSYGPDMVGNGESLFIWEWFYGFDVPIADIAYFDVVIESETSSYTEYAKIDGQAFVSDGIAYALVENTTDADIYGIQSVIVVENADGVLLDVRDISGLTSNGIFPGSTLVQRQTVKDYANDKSLMEGNATAYVLYELD
ncbi:MAG: hypothetical protein IKU34_01180 [Clostridia bacterium]|nr:hypothetical protein [Clostridia bacterium]